MIEKAIKHLKNTFSKERIYRKKEDLDALNEIIKAFNEIEKNSLKRNNLFTKLFINEFLRHTTISRRTSTEAILEINRLLEIPTEEYYHKMRNEIPQLRFKAVSDKIGVIPRFEIKDGVVKANLKDEQEKHNREVIAKHQKVLERALTTEYTEQELKAFLDQHLFKTIIKYASYA